MPIYRFFPVKTYRAVHWIDVEAPNRKTAEKAALMAMRKLDPDPRQTAVDNGWHIEGDSTSIPELPSISYPKPEMYEMQQIMARDYKKGEAKVFMNKNDLNQTKKRYRKWSRYIS
jgi:hypothetical protein